MWPGQTSPESIPLLSKPAYRPLQGTGGGVQVVKTHLVENGGERFAPIQSRFSNVTDKLRLMMMMMMMMI